MNELPQSWTLVRLEEAVEQDAPIIYGILQPGPHIPDGVPYVRPTEIVHDVIDVPALRRTTAEIAERYRRASLETGDVLLSIVGTIGKVAVVPQELDGGNITQSSCRMRPRRSLTSKEHIAQFLRSPLARSQFDQARLGTAVPRLNLEDVRNFEMPLPPLPEQRRIVAKIDSLTGKSRRARDHLDHIPRLVEKYKQSVLAAAFRGDLTREWRARQRVVAAHRTAIFREILQDIRYGTANKCDYDGGQTPVLRIPNVQRGKIVLDKLKSADFSIAEFRKLRLRIGDVLVIRSNGSLGLVGRSAVVDASAVGMLFAGYLIRLRLDLTAAFPNYVHLWLQTNQMRSTIEGLAKSTSGVNNVNSSQLEQLPIRLPNLDEQREIVRRIETAFAWIDRLAADATSARKLIDRLDQAVLTKAFRGELVPQDPTDEPASVLLERISAEREASPKARRGRKGKAV